MKIEHPIHPKSEFAECLRDAVNEHSLAAVVQFLGTICEEYQRRWSPPFVDESANTRRHVKQWTFAKSGVRGLDACLQYLLEVGPNE